MRLDLQHNIDALLDQVDDLERVNVPKAIAYGLNECAKEVRDAEYDAMRAAFDRPTPRTLNAIWINFAQAPARLYAEVNFKDQGRMPAAKYLLPEVEGGPRRHKAFELRLIRAGLMRANEYAVPAAGVPLDAYGNVSGALIERILSQVQAAEQFEGYQANATKRSLKRASRKRAGRYFVLRPDAAEARYMRRNVQPGIYWRKGVRGMVPVFAFVRQPQYARRLPYFERATAIVQASFPRHFAEGLRIYTRRY